MKKKLLTVCLAVILIAVTVNGTLAYFTDSKTAMNTFTAGNVEITLDESAVTPPGHGSNDYIRDVTRSRVTGNAYKNLCSGMSIWKDPCVTLKDCGGLGAYIKVEMLVSSYDLDSSPIVSGGKLINPTEKRTDGNVKLLSGELADLTHVSGQKWDGKDGTCIGDENDPHYCFVTNERVSEDSYRITYYFLKPIMKGDSITLFNTINIFTDWNKAQLATLDNATVDIKAYAIQAEGFSDAAKAFGNL